MAGIAGVTRPGHSALVEKMLDRIAHRGRATRRIIETRQATLGVVSGSDQPVLQTDLAGRYMVCDCGGNERLASAQVMGDKLTLVRDAFGVAPLYYDQTDDGALCFASEVKALLAATRDVHELPAGASYDGLLIETHYRLAPQMPVDEPPEVVAAELRHRLAGAVGSRIANDEAGAWLSGGLDSSALAALARPHVDHLHTFSAGLPGAPDLAFAAEVAAFIHSDHHEVVVTFDEMLAVLPEVIYHLESFDALLVRSSITNYLVAQAASDYVPAVFSGEGGDELFAGYAYLKYLEPAALPDELIDITGRLHNTALQRVDRCASAHGTLAHVAFLDPDVVEYALQIPAEYKLRDGIEKWILRRAMNGALPERVLGRTKAKFWEGAGVGDLLARYADAAIADTDFRQARRIPNGWTLDSKEELLYYRIFREWFGALVDLSWMGRSKGAPQAPA
jgi:asparagine synthase (glutamine-hydrolysing)